jgi:ABC-2 type transport system ATP-binding protein
MLAVHVQNLVKSYGSKRLLDGVNLDVREGQFYALMGPNGSGKTTLASIIAAVRTADSGIIEIYGSKPAQSKRFIGYVPQENFSSRKLSGRENLTYFATLLGYSRNEASQLVTEMLESTGLSGEADKRVDKYSGRMRKRLEVATAIFPGMKVLILDEPTTGLDPAARKAFFTMVQEIMNKKTSIILITHIGSDAEVASRAGLIDNGRIIAEGTPDELNKEHTVEDVITVETAVKSDVVLSVLKGFSIDGRVAASEAGYRICSRDGDRIVAVVVLSLLAAGLVVLVGLAIGARFTGTGAELAKVIGFVCLIICASAGVGLIVGTLIRHLQGAIMTGVGIAVITSALSGLFAPYEVLPAPLQLFPRVYPISSAHASIVSLMAGPEMARYNPLTSCQTALTVILSFFTSHCRYSLVFTTRLESRVTKIPDLPPIRENPEAVSIKLAVTLLMHFCSARLQYTNPRYLNTGQGWPWAAFSGPTYAFPAKPPRLLWAT